MEKNSQDELSDAQAEEVADIVDALTFELRSELKVLGAEVDALGKDVDELEEKVAMMDVPEDNIEFGMDVTTSFEVASYDVESGSEQLATMALWADGDALDLDLPVVSDDSLAASTGLTLPELADVIDDDGNIDWAKFADKFEGEDYDVAEVLSTLAGTTNGVANYPDFSWEDADDLPSEKRFWQEYDFNINGMLGDAKFNLDVDTITNSFMDEDSAFGYSEGDSNDFAMDTALLTVQYGDFTAIAGDHEEVTLAPYFVDDEDLEGLAVVTNQFGWDWNFLVASLDDQVEDDIYGFTASKDMDYGTVTGKVYQARKVAEQVSVVGLAVSDVEVTDVVTVGGECFCQLKFDPFIN